MSILIKAGGGLVQNEHGQVLLIHRRGHWDLPKGKLDDGETIEECALREVEEETGLKNIMLKKMITITIHEYIENDQPVKKETTWFLMKVTGEQKLSPQREEDITDARWINTNDLPAYLSGTYENIRQVIDQSGLLN
ncbi:MAG: hypothetical protein JWN76_3531 [Chitinophagaceae bacterium]|nr:hypothetical protein [Chitinophagaceae bacterium]